MISQFYIVQEKNMGMPSLSLKINVCSDVHENIWTMQKCVKRARKMTSSATPTNKSGDKNQVVYRENDYCTTCQFKDVMRLFVEDLANIILTKLGSN